MIRRSRKCSKSGWAVQQIGGPCLALGHGIPYNRLRKNHFSPAEFRGHVRLEQARSVWLIWFVLFIWFIWFIQLVWFNLINKTNQTNQLNETDQTDRTDQMNKRGWRTFSASCSKCGSCAASGAGAVGYSLRPTRRSQGTEH